MRITTNQLRLFIDIIDAGGLTNAAKLAGLSQPALSSALGRLEREIGVKLFARGPHGLVPSEFGRTLEEPARRTLADSTALSDLAASLSDGRYGRISLALGSNDAHLPSVTTALRVFSQHYPEVQVRLSLHSDSDSVVKCVAVGHANVGVTTAINISASLDRIDLRPQQYVLALPARRNRRTTIDALAADGPLPFIQTAGLNTEVLRWFGEQGIELRTVVTDAPADMTIWLLEQQVGAALLPAPFDSLITAAGGWSLPLPPALPSPAAAAGVVFPRGLASRPTTELVRIIRAVNDRPETFLPPAPPRPHDLLEIAPPRGRGRSPHPDPVHIRPASAVMDRKPGKDIPRTERRRAVGG